MKVSASGARSFQSARRQWREERSRTTDLFGLHPLLYQTALSLRCCAVVIWQLAGSWCSPPPDRTNKEDKQCHSSDPRDDHAARLCCENSAEPDSLKWAPHALSSARAPTPFTLARGGGHLSLLMMRRSAGCCNATFLKFNLAPREHIAQRFVPRTVNPKPRGRLKKGRRSYVPHHLTPCVRSDCRRVRWAIGLGG